MPLADIVRTINAQNRRPLAGVDARAPFFIAADGRVCIHYAGLLLESRFLPYLETASGRVLGYAAELVASGLERRLQLEPEAVFALPTDAAELIQLDRLVRSLHALNYLLHHGQGTLILKVHPRHVAGVADDHGLAFEEIIRPCGLLPESITLDINVRGIEDRAHLRRAVDNYRSRGYGIALSHFGIDDADFDLLSENRPGIARLHSGLLASGRPLYRLADRLHRVGGLSMAGAWELPARPRADVQMAIDLLATRAGKRLRHASAPLPF